MEKKCGIDVKHVYKSFGKEKVLNDICLRVHFGSVVGIVGSNGSGKTVLMKCMCGFLQPDSGEIWVSGKHIGKDCDFPESLGVIIETPGFLPHISGYKNLKLLADLKGIIGHDEICQALSAVGLDPTMKKPVAKYSLGMRQRLGIAQAIMENPEVLILDEPFNGLDKKSVFRMRELLTKLKSEGKAIVLASHNAQDIEALCDDVYDMEAQRNETMAND